MIYLTKYLAQIGITSRRQAENLIRNSQITINGEKAKLGEMITGKEEIKIKGKLINKKKRKKIVIIFNKPIGYTCTNRKFKGENNIFDLLPSKYKNLIIAGRLDKNSQGLILLTNDGELAYKITHPRFGHEKKYLVRFDKNNKINLNKQDLYNLVKNGVRSENGEILKIKNIYQEKNNWVVILNEGKKRHIRRLFANIGLKVIYLKRFSIGNLDLGNLPLGAFKILSEKDTDKILRRGD